MANPEFEDESSVDVFDFWEGANFKLKIRKVDGELKTRLDVVLGNTQTAAMSAPTTVDSSEVPFDGGQPISKPSSTEEGQDENLDYFKKLAEG